MEYCDVALVGAGPSNLSLAAHLYHQPNLSWQVFEKRSEPRWHQGMLLSNARLQSSHFKDLIFLSDPGSPFTFFNYLHEKGILYQYIHAEFSTPLRRDFDRYLQWVLRKLGSGVRLGESAEKLDYNNGHLILHTDQRCIQTQNIVVGMGHVPFVPGKTCTLDSKRTFHSSRYSKRRSKMKDLRGKVIAIVGGGQSAAEIVLDLISDDKNLPHRIIWLVRGLKFRMFDETILSNDIYTPEFAAFFFRQSSDFRIALNETYKSSSDGIVADLMLSIFRRFYVLEQEMTGMPDRRVLLGRTFEQIKETDDKVKLTCQVHGQSDLECHTADIAIFATGYQQSFGQLEHSLDELIVRDDSGNPVFEKDYRLRLLPHLDGVRVFAQNASIDAYGWMDPNLGGTSYRSARIANTLLGTERYSNSSGPSFASWDKKA